MGSYSSPLLDEFNRTGVVSPPLQRAMDIVKTKLAPSVGTPAAATVEQLGQAPMTVLGQRVEPSQPQMRVLGQPVGATPSMAGATPAHDQLMDRVRPLSPAAQAHQAELDRLTTGETGKSGIDQIHNAWLRTPLKVLGAVAEGFAPRLAAAIPGTDLHHALLVRQVENAVNQDQKTATEEANRAHLTAETNEANARAGSLSNPQPKEKPIGSTVTVNGRVMQFDPATDRYSIDVGSADKDQREGLVKGTDGSIIGWTDTQGRHHDLDDPDTPPAIKSIATADKAKVAPNDQPLGNRVENLNRTLADRYQVLNPGKPLPAEYTLGKEGTQADYNRIDKALEANERAAGTKTARDQAEEDRRHNREIEAGNRQQKTDVATRQASFKAYQPAMDSAERFAVMAKNYDDAVKNHDQQAMLSLLANHLGMTMGLQKGSRLTQDIINEAIKSRPWLQGIGAKFDKDGYLSGVTLTPAQMKQMLDLGRDRFAEDIRKSGSEARYLGATDEGPDRIANKSVMGYYMDLAGNDVSEAKRLAKQDGWTVK